MIELTSSTSNGLIEHLLHPDAIAKITQASPSSQWHGIRAIIKLFDGSTLEVTQSVDKIGELLEKTR